MGLENLFGRFLGPKPPEITSFDEYVDILESEQATTATAQPNYNETGEDVSFYIQHYGQTPRRRISLNEFVGQLVKPEYPTRRWVAIDLRDGVDRTFLTADNRLKVISRRIVGITTTILNKGKPMTGEDYQALLKTVQAMKLTPWS